MNYKKTSLLLVLIGAVFVFALLADVLKDRYLRNMITREIEQQTGLQVSLEGLRYNLLKGEFEMTGFVLKNPTSFGDSNAIEIDRLLIKAGLRTLLSDTVLVDICEVDIGFIGIIDTPDLDSNFQVIADLLKGKSSPVAQDKAIAGAAAVEDEPGADDYEPREYLLSRNVAEQVRSKDINITDLRIYLGAVHLMVASQAGQRPIEMTVRVDDTFEFSGVEDLDDILDELLTEIMAVAGPQLLIEVLSLPQ